MREGLPETPWLADWVDVIEAVGGGVATEEPVTVAEKDSGWLSDGEVEMLAVTVAENEKLREVDWLTDCDGEKGCEGVLLRLPEADCDAVEEIDVNTVEVEETVEVPEVLID